MPPPCHDAADFSPLPRLAAMITSRRDTPLFFAPPFLFAIFR